MIKIRPRHAILVALLAAGLAGCSTATGSSPASASSPVTFSPSAPATGSSTFITGGPPSTSQPATPNGLPADWNSPAHAKAFFAQIEPAAAAAMKTSGIPASLIMAIAGHESAFGQTGFATQAKNLFAQACAKSANCVGAYKKYKDWTSSIQDFASRMASSPVVRAVMAIDPGAVSKIASAIAGIQSLDPGFAQKVTGLIGQYNLRQADVLGV